MHVYCLEVHNHFSRQMVGYLVYMVGSVYGLAMAGGAVEVNKLLPT